MPDLDLRDENDSSEQSPEEYRSPGSTRYLRGGGGDGTGKVFLIAIILLLVIGVVMLNQFGVIHLWGSKETPVVVDLPPLDNEEIQPVPEPRDPFIAQIDTPSVTESPMQTPEQTGRVVAGLDALPPGSGNFTVQLSAWRTKERAENQAGRIRAAGKPAYVDEKTINGVRWYRVRVGRYGSREDATRDARNFQLLMESGWWVDRIDG